MLGEKGSLKDTSVVKLLLTSYEEGFTGVLHLSYENALKDFYFDRGHLIWAVSNSERDMLENILISYHLVAPKNVERVKSSLENPQLLGKTLVEKGLLSLEELIEASKSQVKGIVLSVLRWKEGIFEFVEEPPPDGLLNLDLNVTDFVTDFILKELHIGYIQDEIGSLQVYFEKTPDERKIEKYNLSDKQLALLDSFDGETSLDQVLSRHSGASRESLMKIIYFFLVSEIVVEKIELAVSSLLEDESDGAAPDEGMAASKEVLAIAEEVERGGVEGGDDQETGADLDKILFTPGEELVQQTSPVPDEEIMPGITSTAGEEMAGVTKSAPGSAELEKVVPILDEEVTGKAPTVPDIEFPVSVSPPGEEELEQAISILSEEKEREERTEKVMIPFDDEERAEEPAPPHLDMVEDKKKIKQLYFLLIFVALILIISGVIFLYLNSAGKDQKRAARSGDDSGTIIDVDEQKPRVQVEPGKDKSAAEPESQKPKKTVTGKPQETAAETGKDSIEDICRRLGINSSELRGKFQDSVILDHFEITRADSAARKSFKKGNFIEAGSMWKRELEDSGARFAVLLEMDCLKQSVVNAYLRIKQKNAFFILNRKLGERDCFLVMWGRFATRQEAADQVKSIPDYFWQQENPPVIVPLSKYID